MSEHPLIHLRVVAKPNIWGPAVQISIYGFGVAATAFILPDLLTRVQGLRDLQIGYTLNWIALPQFVLVPLAAILLRRTDARLLIAFGFALIAYGSWLATGLTHDWVGQDFLPSQIIEAVGLAFGITTLIVFGVSNITPAEAATIAAVIQTARLLGNEAGGALVQTFVRVREQVYSNLTGLHFVIGSHRAERAVTQVRGAVRRPSDRGRRPDFAKLFVDWQFHPPRSLCPRLHRRVLADRLGADRRDRADGVPPAAAAQSADPAARRSLRPRPACHQTSGKSR